MSIDWSPLRAELARHRADGLSLPFWWRDDDATAPTPALHRLLKLSAELDLPVHIAVIPKTASPDLAEIAGATPLMVPIVHGWAHENRAPEGAKRAEFGHPDADAAAKTEAALRHMRQLFGRDMLAMFVPPWNRIDPSVTSGLAAQGYRALSTFTPRKARRCAGLVQINTHIDPIAWRAGGGLMPPEAIIAKTIMLLQDRRSGRADCTEPLGFLSHHLVQDAAIWDFARGFLSELLDGGAEARHLLRQPLDLP
ncbi:polysaccharide deacetylase [Sulfitobacter sp. PS-8MA]|uniref:polysaccharide deacetylase n=1 Tax=Sulfitobacter sp. PS-8MA TaxID=3237707 RepID=UPI0034C69CD7